MHRALCAQSSGCSSLQELAGKESDDAEFAPPILPMPTRGQLEAQGEHRLVKGIINAGGFSSVARKLGLRPPRRANGFWDNLEILNEVLR